MVRAGEPSAGAGWLVQHPGTLIVLNGASSAGKSSILAHLQRTLDGPFLNAGIDKFIFMLPNRYLNRPLWDEIMGKADRAGDQGHIFFAGMHHALAAMARQGNHLLVDHVLVEPSWVAQCAVLFADLPAYLIGIHCPLDILERRERERKDRTLGQARLHFDLVHQHGLYDLEVDTSLATAETCAATIADYLASGAPPTAFRQLRQRAPIGKDDTPKGL
jgi:chloramphenicol 3-O phosphotransferase